MQLYAFDVLALDGEDLRALPLSLRKTNLARLLARRPDGIFVAPFESGEIGPDLFRAACNMGLEGLVSKRRDRPSPASEVIQRPSQRRLSCDLAAVAARSPGTRATRTTLAAAATSAAAAPTPTSAAAATTPTPGQLHTAAKVFPIEQMERGETDVGHFLFAKNEAVIGRGIVRLRTGSGHRGSGCTTYQ